MHDPQHQLAGPRRPHRRGRTEPVRALLVGAGVVALAMLVVVGLRFVPGSPLAAGTGGQNTSAGTATGAAPTHSAAPTPDLTREPTAEPTLSPLAVQPASVTVDATGWWSWAMMDRRTGEIVGSTNMAETSTTASLIKAWIAADYLRRSATAGVTPSQSRLHEVSIMIRDSDNNAAQDLWQVIGQSAAIGRLIKTCELTDSSPFRNLWSNTRLSPRDITRLGACIADGRAAGPRWTTWLLKEMRLVRGVGDFGIRRAFPAGDRPAIAIKNGWVTRDAQGTWHVNCLAIGDGWTMGVMARYPINLDYTYGAKICKSVASQLRVR